MFKPTLTLLSHSILAKLSLIVVLTSTVTLTGVGLWQYATTRDKLEKDLDLRAKIDAKRLAVSFQKIVWDYDKEAAHDVILAEMEEKSVYGVQVWEEEAQEALYGGWRDEMGKPVSSIVPLAKGDFISVNHEILRKNKTIGKVSVFLTKRYIQEELNHALWEISSRVVLLDVVIVLVLTVLIRLFLVKPLETIRSAMEMIQEGEMDQVLPVTSSDEIGTIAHSFNLMVTQLKEREEALLESEQKFRLIFDQTFQFIGVLSVDGVVLEANQTALQFAGVKKEDVIGKPFWDTPWWAHSSGQQQQLREAVEEAATGKLVRREFTHPFSRDGKLHYIDFSLKPVINAEGLVTQLISEGRDISDRKRGEEQTRQVARQLDGINQLQQLLLESVPLETKLLAVTDGVVKYFGADLCRIWLIRPGDRCVNCIHAKMQDGTHVCRHRDECLHLIASSGQCDSNDGDVYHRVPFGCYKIGTIASGSAHKFLINDVASDPQMDSYEWASEQGFASFVGYRIHPADGKSIGVLALFSKQPILPSDDAMLDSLSSAVALALQQDAAEEKLRQANIDLESRVEERTYALVKSEERFKDILASSSDWIWEVDTEGVYTFCSGKIYDVLGYQPDEILGLTPFDLMTAEEGGRVREQFEFLVSQKLPIVNLENWNLSKDGRLVCMLTSGVPILDKEGNLEGYRGADQDITERKHFEREIIAANQAKSDFLAGMSHEIRTPINAILGMLYLVLQSEMPTSLRIQLQKAENAAKSLLGIINDILDFSKIEAGKLEIECIAFDPEKVVQQVVDTLTLQAQDKNLEYVIRYDVNIPDRLLGDPLRLAQIMLNLCSNAIKFTESGEVEIALKVIEHKGDELLLLLLVRDTGIGMNRKQQGRLFEKFSQVDQRSTRRFDGTGLGLAISKNLVTLMGGDIWVESSAPDCGTTMACKIRLGVAQEAKSCKDTLLEQAGTLIENLRVLVVDDHKGVCEILTETLNCLGVEADSIINGTDAIEMLEQAKSRPYDLVLMDWCMPGMNGDEVVQRIRADSNISRQPKITMHTAYGSDDVVRSAKEAGVDSFLTKPVVPSMLLDTLLSTLGQELFSSSSPRSSSVETTESELETGKMQILLAEDNEINREFAVQLLLSNGIEVDCAVNGLEAVEMIQSTSYDAVLMDVQMPELDGLEATRRIRGLSKGEGDRFARVPIIAMTAMAMVEDREKSLAAGMNDHITKPIDFGKLLETLRSLVNDFRHKSCPVAPGDAGSIDAELLASRDIDVVQAIRRIGNNPDAYRRQLQRFYGHYAQAVETLQGLITQEGVGAGESFCHELKGVCATIGATTLTTCVTELDDLLKRGEIPGAEQFREMERLLNNVIDQISVLSPILPQQVLQTLSDEDLRSKFTELSELLSSDLGAAEKLLVELRALTAGSDLQGVMEEIATSFDAFAIDEALDKLRGLRVTTEEQ